MMTQKKNLLTVTGWMAVAALLTPPAQNFFQTQGLRWLFIFLFSLLLSLLITPIARQLAFRFKFLDQPDYRKTHKNPTPVLGGLAVYLAFTISLLINNIFDRATFAILAAGSLIMVVSLVDDRKNLSAKLKLLVQLAATCLVIWAGIRITLFPIYETAELSNTINTAGNLILSFLWIVGITNAMNFLDGIDGLASGLGVVISLFLAIISFQTNQPYLGWFSLAMMGACLGFLPYNFRKNKPALIFLGDNGSTFIGFTLACLAIRGDWAAHSPLISTLTPVLLFGVLIFDMIHTTIARIHTGKVRTFQEWVAYVGKDHIHHRLFRLFQCKRKTVFMILAISGCLGVSAVVLRQVDSFLATLIVLQGGIGFMMFSAVNYFQERAFLKIRQNRSGFRIQEFLDVTIGIPKKKMNMQGVLLDISDSGAKILANMAMPISEGSTILLGAKELADSKISPPTGKVLWKRPVIIDEDLDKYNEDFFECGIQFENFDQDDFLTLIKELHYRQIIYRQERYVRHTNRPAVESLKLENTWDENQNVSKTLETAESPV